MLWMSGPLLILRLVLLDRVERARNAADRGASAIEWVIISAILVMIAVALGGLLYRKIMDKAESIDLGT